MPKRRAESSRAGRVGGVAVRKRVDRLARSVAEIEVALRLAEAKIVADAWERICTLRKEAMEQLAVLRDHQGGRPAARRRDVGLALTGRSERRRTTTTTTRLSTCRARQGTSVARDG